MEQGWFMFRPCDSNHCFIFTNQQWKSPCLASCFDVKSANYEYFHLGSPPKAVGYKSLIGIMPRQLYSFYHTNKIVLTIFKIILLFFKVIQILIQRERTIAYSSMTNMISNSTPGNIIVDLWERVPFLPGQVVDVCKTILTSYQMIGVECIPLLIKSAVAKSIHAYF